MSQTDRTAVGKNSLTTILSERVQEYKNKSVLHPPNVTILYKSAQSHANKSAPLYLNSNLLPHMLILWFTITQIPILELLAIWAVTQHDVTILIPVIALLKIWIDLLRVLMKVCKSNKIK